jgi:hypothetical protein
LTREISDIVFLEYLVEILQVLNAYCVEVQELIERLGLRLSLASFEVIECGLANPR